MTDAPNSSPIAGWTTKRIDAECSSAYAAYHATVRDCHVAYYAGRPDERNEAYAFAGRDRAVVFPPGLERLADLDLKWHRHHLSGGSSQILAVALIASALERDPESRWLFGGEIGAPVSSQFEYELSPKVLNEQPRVTSVDWLLDGETGLACVEAKFTEPGLGRCSCTSRVPGECSSRVLERPYWDVARAQFGLHGPEQPKPCELGVAYQAVRNGAAALALAGPRRAAFFGLLYDERNPYFAGAGSWPGWIDVLTRAIDAGPDLRFIPFSWQELLRRAPVPDSVRVWAREKHGLE